MWSCCKAGVFCSGVNLHQTLKAALTGVIPFGYILLTSLIVLFQGAVNTHQSILSHYLPTGGKFQLWSSTINQNLRVKWNADAYNLRKIVTSQRKKGNYYWRCATGIIDCKSSFSSDTLPCIKTIQSHAHGGGGEVNLTNLVSHRYPSSYKKREMLVCARKMFYRKVQSGKRNLRL